MSAGTDGDFESQDLAEVFDETNTTPDGEMIAEPDLAPYVLDVTAADDDADDDELDTEVEDAADFAADQIDETELDRMLGRDDGIDDDDREGEDAALNFDDEGDLVSTEDETASDYQGERFVTAKARGKSSDRVVGVPVIHPSRSVEERLDEGLAESFPASDPVSINSGAD